MRYIKYSAMLLCIAFFLSSCKRDAVVLDFTNAKGEVPLLGNLVFKFNRSLVKDSMVNAWDSADYISFEPRIPGRFRWESPEQLVFSPAQPLLPATSYSAKINNEVLRYSKYDKVEAASNISFNTPSLTLQNAQVTWILNQNNAPAAQLELFFNYRVNPKELADHLELTMDGKESAFHIQTGEADNKVFVILKEITASRDQNSDLELRVSITKGLVPQNGRTSTREEISQTLLIPSPYVLTVQNVESEHDGTEGTIRVVTNQQLSDDRLASFIEFEPKIAFSTQLDGSALVITSDKFDLEKSYGLTFKKGLRGIIGGSLRENVTHPIAFGQLEPSISFTSSKGVYLSGKGARNLEVRITNVPRVKIVISKIYENNLLSAQRYGYYPSEQSSARTIRYDEDEEEYGYEEYYSSNDISIGDIIYEKEIDSRSLPKSGAGRLLNLAQFEDGLQDFKGIYHVMIRSLENYWVRDSRYISLSDIGLIAKEGEEKFYVFANSIKSASSLSGVSILLYSGNNQLIGSGTTNSDGLAEIDFLRKNYSGFRPAMVVAKTPDDFNYLPLNQTRVNTSRFDVGGKRINSSGMDAFIYGDRDIYRPGETINYSVIIRDRNWKCPEDIPVKIKFLLPNGKELRTFRKSLNAQGSLEGSMEINPSALTGNYVLEVYTSNDILLASRDIRIEEFVPDRIRVDVKPDKNSIRLGETASIAIRAANFFGPPASNRNFETEIQVRPKFFSPSKFKGFDFTLKNRSVSFSNQVTQGKTDDQGIATASFSGGNQYADNGLLDVRIFATVFDETGRPVSRNASIDFYTQDVFYGIKSDDLAYQPLNQPVKFIFAAVDKQGNALNSKAEIHVIKHEYNTLLVRSDSYFRYESQKTEKLLVEQEINVGAATPWTYIPRSPGDYEIRIYRPGGATYVSSSFYSYGAWGWNTSNAFEVNREGQIDIELDKQAHRPGENLKAHFKTPFNGRMLITLESDRILWHKYVDVEKRGASVDIEIEEKHVPNVYLTATLIKPHEVSDIPLTVAHGFTSIKVEQPSRKINVAIRANTTVRSKTKQKVEVTAAPNSYVTLAAVDNGVLQVSNFETPDPYEHFYQKKALQITAYDLYPLLFPELRGRFSSTGGDGDASMHKRTNPMPAKRVKIISYWSGIKKTNSDGKANFEFEIPQFSGQIRLMAVAYKDESFGNAESEITVADPLVISTALPRFLSPGDTVFVPVIMTNTTARSANTSASIRISGPLKLLESAAQTVVIGAGEEGRAGFSIAAANDIGVANLKIDVNAFGEKFQDEIEISVRPASTLQKITSSGTVSAGTQMIHIAPDANFIPSSMDYKLHISRSPLYELSSHISWLVQYPYGCTEQTISSAFPQLYFADFVDQLGLNEGLKSNANTNVMEAIRKLKMRQLYNGGLLLWEQGGQAHWWTSVYAAHFLLEAKRAGFSVDESLINTLLIYLNNKLRDKETIEYYYNRDQVKKIAPKEVAYSLYVLSLAGRANISVMNYYKANQHLLALDSRYLLSATYAIAGDKRSFAAILPSSFSGEESVPQTGGSFYSAVRDEAIALNCLIDVDPAHRQIGEMAKHVAAKMKSRDWLSTQERAFGFLALGKLARKANRSDLTAEVKVNGKTIGRLNGNVFRADMNTLKSSSIEIVSSGTGNLYYFWEAEGISRDGGFREEDNYIRARRKFYDRKGNELRRNSFRQNELIIVELSLEKSYSGNIENIVLTDLLPAGFEIENPRTKEIPGMDWIRNSNTPEALDVRDDRIHFFVDLINQKQVYYYAVRAVSPGKFKLGPVSADAMYNGEYHSYHGSGLISITAE